MMSLSRDIFLMTQTGGMRLAASHWGTGMPLMVYDAEDEKLPSLHNHPFSSVHGIEMRKLF